MYTFFTKLLEFQWVLNVLLVADLSFFLFYYESYAVAKSHPMIYQGCRGCDSMVA
jgi:hypothetical protein